RYRSRSRGVSRVGCGLFLAVSRGVRLGVLAPVRKTSRAGAGSPRGQALVPASARFRSLLRLGVEGSARPRRDSTLARPYRPPLLPGAELRTVSPYPNRGNREASARTSARVAGWRNPDRSLLGSGFPAPSDDYRGRQGRTGFASEKRRPRAACV